MSDTDHTARSARQNTSTAGGSQPPDDGFGGWPVPVGEARELVDELYYAVIDHASAEGLRGSWTVLAGKMTLVLPVSQDVAARLTGTTIRCAGASADPARAGGARQVPVPTNTNFVTVAAALDEPRVR